MIQRICILGAVKEEIAGIKRRMKIEKRQRFGRADVWQGTWDGIPIVLVRGGIGKTRAREALHHVNDHFPLTLVISIGYAGGTHPDLKTGDLLIADHILTEAKEGETPEEIPVIASLAVHIEEGGRFSTFKGPLLTVDRVVRKPEDKKALGEKYGAKAIDMESYELAKIAAKGKLPFLSIRAISDAVDQELVDVSPFMEQDGEISRLKAGWYVLTHPASLKDFKNLKDIAHLATKNLTLFLMAFLRSK